MSDYDYVKGLNGYIRKGDRVAIAVREGNGSAGQRVGEVLAAYTYTYTGFSGKKYDRSWVRVRVDWSSGTYLDRDGVPALPFVKRYSKPSRMVRL